MHGVEELSISGEKWDRCFGPRWLDRRVELWFTHDDLIDATPRHASAHLIPVALVVWKTKELAANQLFDIEGDQCDGVHMGRVLYV
jgi:hypothetical protein